jgi:glutathione S-transferase
MLTVHHLENSRSHRVLWLLEELDADYAIERYERDEDMRAPDSLKEVHPLGKSPVLTDGDITVAESGAVLEYILDEHDAGPLRPEEETEAYRQYRYWMHYAEGSAMPPLLVDLLFNRLVEESPWIVSPLVGKIASTIDEEYLDDEIGGHMEFWEQELTDRPYLTGDTFTAADIQMSFPLAGALGARGDRGEHGNCFDYLERLKSREAFDRAAEKGGEDSPLPG